MSINTASIEAILGASGSGKSAFVKQRLKRERPPRLLIWDPLREYAGHGAIHRTVSGLLDAMTTGGKGGNFRLVFQPASDELQRVKQFNLFCAIALAAGNLTLIVEELRFVTRPSSAPLNWARCTMTGRHVGLSVVGTSQRPASIDKDFLGNCTSIHTGRLVYPVDIKNVADAMGVEPVLIEALKPLAWLQKDMQTGEISGGRVRFPAKKTVPTPTM